MKKILKLFWDDYVRYPISNSAGLLLVVMAFSAAQDRMDYLILAQLMFLSPHIMIKEKK